MAAGFQRIACTQPRRIACHALSKRVAFESANVYGTKIAYQVRFDKTAAPDTRILFVTEVGYLRTGLVPAGDARPPPSLIPFARRRDRATLCTRAFCYATSSATRCCVGSML